MKETPRHQAGCQYRFCSRLPTVDTVIKLTDSSGSGLEGGNIKYYAKKWLEIGATDDNGELHKELLPGKYSFRMEYAGGYQDIKQDVGDDSTVLFQTVDTLIKLTDSTGSGIEGGSVKYYKKGWIDIGITDDNGELHKELLPVKYCFRMEYADGKQDIEQYVGEDSTVDFQTVDTSIKLIDSSGDGLAAGKVKYYGKSWIELGEVDNHGELHQELLPGKYTFRMEYEGGRQDIRQNVAEDQEVVFQTIDVTVLLVDGDGTKTY